MGTWAMGDAPAKRPQEIAALRYGLEHGLHVIDTAEMYGNGRSETLVGEAIAPFARDRVFLVSKVLPSHAAHDDVLKACRQSLARLGTDHLDLYLLHWRSSVPLAETVGAFEALMADGLIRSWGVSNFDVDDMEELAAVPGAQAANGVQANQILYALEYRGTEWDLLEADRAQGVVTMAYSPLGQAKRILTSPALKAIAAKHHTSLGPATPAQIALAWVLRQPGVLAIPKAGTVAHERENIAALEITLSAADLLALDRAFPPPLRKRPLACI
ncbi:aldo/keto reductase [Formicincola oecophyllae]|uniref:Aldo/keto reductase n=2 Tax=Formicincola oecophyllae TaxID=2558361 RepID=A0A4Y6UD97_9PROT|nr:aldo/keto reductase [Formicincola oecophyllae]